MVRIMEKQFVAVSGTVMADFCDQFRCVPLMNQHNLSIVKSGV